MQLFEKRVRDVETFVAVVDTIETRVQETQKVVAELGKKLEKSIRDLTKQWDSTVTELEDDLELRVDEFAKSVRDSSKELQVLAHVPSRTWSDGVMRSRIFTHDLLKIVSRTWSNAGLEGCTASPGRGTNTGCSGWSRPCDHAAGVPAILRVLRASGSVPRQNGGHSSCMQRYHPTENDHRFDGAVFFELKKNCNICNFMRFYFFELK